VGEKTPDHLHHVPDLLEAMPDARVLCIERDGRDVALSLVQAEFTHDWLRVHCHRWLDAIADARTWAGLYPERFRLVAFDELVAEPDRTLAALGEFLGVDWSGIPMRTSIRTPLVPEREAPWKAKALEAPDPSRIDAWRRNASPRQIEIMQGILGDALREGDYEVYEDLPAPALSDRALSAAARGLYVAAYRAARNRLPEGARSALQHAAGAARPQRDTGT
jgi:hypothetical protein